MYNCRYVHTQPRALPAPLLWPCMKCSRLRRGYTPELDCKMIVTPASTLPELAELTAGAALPAARQDVGPSSGSQSREEQHRPHCRSV